MTGMVDVELTEEEMLLDALSLLEGGVMQLEPSSLAEDPVVATLLAAMTLKGSMMASVGKSLTSSLFQMKRVVSVTARPPEVR